MRINAPEKVELARAMLRAYGNSWERIRAAGVMRDGVVYVPMPPTGAVADPAGGNADGVQRAIGHDAVEPTTVRR